MAEHPITPPPELVSEWTRNRGYSCSSELWDYIATQAARWGADTELEACCEWLYSLCLIRGADELRAARRPKPPSLKEQALLQLDTLNADLAMHGKGCDLSQIRRALEALPE